MSAETRARVNAKLKGRTRSEETIAKWRESRKGYRHSQATKDKLRENAFIRVFTDEEKKEVSDRMKGNQHGLGYRHTEEAKAKIGKSKTGELCPLKPKYGSDNYFWKGGVTAKNYSLRINIQRLAEYKTWRNSIFLRDDYKCQFCGKRGGKLQAHHIIPFMDIISKHQIKTAQQARYCTELWDVNNGITYCCDCHWIKHFGHPPKKKDFFSILESSHAN
jgi:NUMOD3 motif/HNH endonuclease